MKIAIIQGHPDPAGGHFGHALAAACAEAARAAGHEVQIESMEESYVVSIRANGSEVPQPVARNVQASRT